MPGEPASPGTSSPRVPGPSHGTGERLITWRRQSSVMAKVTEVALDPVGWLGDTLSRSDRPVCPGREGACLFWWLLVGCSDRHAFLLGEGTGFILGKLRAEEATEGARRWGYSQEVSSQ